MAKSVLLNDLKAKVHVMEHLNLSGMGQDKHCIWPGIPGLVNIQKAIENDHRNS